MGWQPQNAGWEQQHCLGGLANGNEHQQGAAGIEDTAVGPQCNEAGNHHMAERHLFTTKTLKLGQTRCPISLDDVTGHTTKLGDPSSSAQ